MIVLSLFDGMSCGQIALRELGVTIERYYASEVDKFAIQNTMANFPDTVQLGDVRNIDATTLGRIDLLIGGSPCQNFSFAGKRAGMSTKTNEKVVTLSRYMELKAQGFEFEGQSFLFWEYVRILNQVRQTNPGVFFMLENVEMGKQWEDVVNQALGVKGVHINSALVSAQVRKRIYWTNIRTFQTDMFGLPDSAIPQPKDRGILLRDILEENVPERYYLKDEVVAKLLAHKERNKEAGNGLLRMKEFVKVDYKGNVSPNQDKANCLSTKSYHSDMDLLVPRKNRKVKQLNPSKESGGIQPYQQNRVYDLTGQSPALMEGHGGRTINVLVGGGATEARLKRLTPTECSRLQTIPDWYKWIVSETQQYRMLGNGWTVEVIKHILSFLPCSCYKNV